MGAAAESLPHDLSQSFHAVHDLGYVVTAMSAEVTVARMRVAVTAGLRQRGPRVKVPRPEKKALTQRLCQPGISSRDVAHRRETPLERATKTVGGRQCHIAERAALKLEQVEAGAVGVEMGVDETRNCDPASCIDDSIGRGVDLADLQDDAVSDEDGSFAELGGVPVEDQGVV